MIYEWDAAKARANLKKHGVSFTEAATVFLNPLSMTYDDPAHSAGEHREITIGYTLSGELLFVSHCQRGERLRMISARKATRSERWQFERQDQT